MRSLVTLALLLVIAYVGVTVPLGEKTLFGHMKAIWGSDEAQELVDGVKESSGPMLDKLNRAVQAGVDEARKGDPGDAGEGDADRAEGPELARKDGDRERDRDRDGVGPEINPQFTPRIEPKIDIHVSP